MRPVQDSGDDLLDHAGVILYPGQSLVEATEGKRQPLVINTKAVQDGGVKITDLDWVADNVVAEIIGRPVLHSTLDATPGHPDGKAATMVIAPVVIGL